MKFEWHASLWNSRFSKVTLPQSLLLTALRGTGEAEFAERVAVSRLCAQLQSDGDACGLCNDCRWFVAGTHPDFRRLDPEFAQENEDRNADDDAAPDKKKARTQISVDEVREASDFLRLAAHRGRARVVMIHPAHSIHLAAANALLKVLEEPPPGALFLLVTSQPTRLPATIRSRCVTIALPKPTPAQAAAWLAGAGLQDASLALAQVGGAPAAALALGERYWTVREGLMPFLTGHDRSWLEAAARIVETDLAHLVHVLQTWCWDLASARFRGPVRYHRDRSAELGRTAPAVEPIELADFARKLSGARRLLGHPLNPKLFAEDLLMSYSRLLPKS